MTVAGNTYTGTGASPSFAWDGKDSGGKVVEPGSYSATLTTQTADGKCSDSRTINFEVVPALDDQCGLLVTFGSSANMASGNLSHSQELFSAGTGSLATSITLYYNSLDGYAGPLGTGWSHSYDIAVKQNGDGSVVFRKGNGGRKLYKLSNGAYVSQPGDTSVLTKAADGTFVLTQKDGTKYQFGQDGRIASIVDPNNNAMTFVHTSTQTTITDGNGRVTTLNYDANGHISSVTAPNGAVYTFSYSGGLLSSVAYPGGGTWGYTYDAKGFMLSKTDPQGGITTYTYDAGNRVVSSTDTEGKTRAVSYPQGGSGVQTTSFTEKDGGVWQYQYDTDKGILTQKTDPQGAVTSYTYDAAGNRLSTVAPDGSTTSATYDAASNRLTSTDALGKTTTYTYNALGQVTTITDPDGKVTSYAYDTKGNLTQTTDPAGAITKYQYDTKGNMATITDPTGKITTFTYDQNNNLASVKDPAGAMTTFAYDALGNMTAQTDPLGKTTRFEYDPQGRLTKTIDPLGNSSTFGYDAAGNKISQTDANGNVTRFEYNAKGQLVRVIDPLGNATTFAYGASGCASCGGGTDKLTSVTDANGNVTSYEYDLSGRLVKEIDPLGNITTFTYDAKGNLATKTDCRGYTTIYTYDQAGRLLTKTPKMGTGDLVTFTYASDGKILTAQTVPFYSTTGFPYYVKYTYVYDAAGQIASVTDTRGRTISYQYDAAGNRTKMTAPDGKITTYAYDANNRLAALTSPSGTFSFVYDSLGRRTKLTYPNKVATTYGYDVAGRLTSLITKTSTGKLISSYSYTYDKAGNRISKAEPDINYTYTYDSLDRLLKSLASVSTRNEEYSYDGVGNRLSGPKTTTHYTYGGANELLSDGIFTYQYDKNGNMTSRSQSDNFSFYDDNRLRGNKGYDFYYDALGRRLSWNNGNANTFSRVYLYDGDNILYEDGLNGTTSYTTRYTHNLGVDDVLAMERGGVRYYYHKDGLGSVTAITDSKGNVVQTYDYDSFGNIVAQKSTTFVQPYTYTGREWDREAGLYYLRNRYYDPMEGRFISKDPIGFRGGDTNLYAYVKNNPINFKDPFGLSAYPGVPTPNASDFFEVLQTFLSFYHAVNLTNEAMSKIDAARAGLPCGQRKRITLCFNPGPPPSNVQVYDTVGAIHSENSSCTVLEVSGSNCCH